MKTNQIRPRSTLLVAVALVIVATGTVAASDDAAAQDVDAWLDTAVTEGMREHGVPGVVVGLVAPDQPPILRAYGLANVERGLPMDPEETVVPVASVTKIYTAAAVLELVAAGKLDLDADVTSQVSGLSFHGDFDEPITLRHLLTHTSGLDERNLDRYVLLEDADPSARAYLLDSMPRRIRPPGMVYQYSNHGMALAGVVAEETAGRPFPELLEQLVLHPLGMDRSSLRPGTPPDAVGYVDADGTLVARPPHHVRTAYSGMLRSTARDQVRMLRALLTGEGLATTTIDGLTSREFSHDAVSPGTAFGMFEDRWSGTTYFWHEGQTRGFYAGFYVVPERGVGLFIAYNRHRGALARSIRYAWLNRAVGPPALETDLTGQGTPIDLVADRIEGTYRFVRHARATPEFILSSLLGRAGEIEVVAEDDGRVRVGHARFVHAGDLLFVEPETGAVNGFIAGPDGTADYLYYQRSAFERIGLLEGEQVRDGWIAFSVILYALTLSTWAILGLRRRLKRRPRDTRTIARWLQLPGIAAQLAFFGGLLIIAGQFRGDTMFQMLFPWSPWMVVVFALPWAALLLAPVQLIAAVAAWRSPAVRRLEHVHHGLLAVFAVVFVGGAWTWGLL